MKKKYLEKNRVALIHLQVDLGNMQKEMKEGLFDVVELTVQFQQTEFKKDALERILELYLGDQI